MGMKIRGERKAFSIEVWFFSYYFILFLRLHFFYLSQCMRLITFGGRKYLSSDRQRRKKKFWAKNNRQQRKNILSNHQQPTEEQGNLIDRIVVEDWKINFDKMNLNLFSPSFSFFLLLFSTFLCHWQVRGLRRRWARALCCGCASALRHLWARAPCRWWAMRESMS